MPDLTGITVVAVEQAVAAPYASMMLADAGARVIKVERPTGDFARAYDRTVLEQSAYFVWLNRGKESLCVDLREPDDVVLLRRIISGADVLIQNLKPGSLERIGLSPVQLCEAHPRLISCDITGFGSTGPRSGLKAYDLIVQAEVGLCSITGNAQGPARVGVSVCDIAAGMTTYAAILQALFARERSGRGRRIQVSLFDSMADWMNVPFLQLAYGGVHPARDGVAHPTIAPYGAYACAGGEELVISIQNDREWVIFCDVFLEDPALASAKGYADNVARVNNRADVDAVVARAVGCMTLEEAARRLEQTGIAYGRLNRLDQALMHPHLRQLIVETPQGEVRVIAPAAIHETAPTAGKVPELGEHSAALRREFGG